MLACGAGREKSLNIPGESLNGVFTAKKFVSWYNGHPAFRDLDFNLHRNQRAVIIGQGNVSLDLARILLTDIDKLRQYDLPDYCLEQLAQSKIREVQIVGRRGPLQAAFTVGELRDILKVTGLQMKKSDIIAQIDTTALPRRQQRMIKLLQDYNAKNIENSVTYGQNTKTIELMYLLAPKRFLPRTLESDKANVLGSIEFAITRLDGLRSIATSKFTTLETGLAFISIGQESVAPVSLTDAGVPFCAERGLRCVSGRVIDNENKVVPGMYASGWIANRKARGVIADTMMDAYETADAFACDWESQVLPRTEMVEEDDPVQISNQSAEKVRLNTPGKELLMGKCHVSWPEWLLLEEAEYNRGRSKGKIRDKWIDTASIHQFLAERSTQSEGI